MTTTELDTSLDDQRLTTILPLIDAAWATGEPSDVQIAAVCLAVMQTPGVDLSCREALQPWFDRAHPPTDGQLASLRARVTSTMSAAPAD